MTTPRLMIQGCGSNVGKSVLVAGLARAFADRGLRVAPFKPQNMSNNAAVTADGGEIGRAQALQARAARREPVSDMNPVLLKPETERGAQVVLRGKALTRASARDYAKLKPTLMRGVLDAFSALEADADLMLVEGAGSPAEINLRAGDIANMGFARATLTPVVLIGDIDRGGVIAQLVGTHAVLDPEDAALVKGFAINKFRGDPSLFDDGYAAIEARTGWRGFGVIPWFAEARRLPAEDASDIRPALGEGTKVCCLRLSRIANFDDLDPFAAEPGLRVEMVEPGEPIPGDAAVVIVPGSKSTRGDLAFLRAQGWDVDLIAHRRRGGRILGLCGGYQMLGRVIEDPQGHDGAPGTSEGLGLLDLATVMTGDKALTRVRATTQGGATAEGYEIHVGRTEGPDRARPLFHVEGRPEGAVSADGLVAGTYLHGCFASDAARAEWLAAWGQPPSPARYEDGVEAALDGLAAHLSAHLDLDALLATARSAPSFGRG